MSETPKNKDHLIGTRPEEPSGPAPPSSIRAIVWIVLGVILITSSVLVWFLSYVYRPAPLLERDEVVIFIPRGASSRSIAELLAEKKLINEDSRFLLLVRLMGRSANLQAGEFSLHTSQTPLALIRELSTARPLEHKITIPEGLTIAQTADLFSVGQWVSKKRFLELCRDQPFIEQLGLVGLGSLEGYLFPETYRLKKPSKGEKEIITMLVNQSLSVYKKLISDHGSELDRHQIFTLASIIEKESGAAHERPIIASVFFNRLNKRMRLQSDPTVIYGLGKYGEPITKTDLRTDTPYNTYLIPGLPPGPIANPGSDSLQAVLSPAQTDYFYFVSKNDGTHHFSTTLKEHNRAVRKYQRNR